VFVKATEGSEVGNVKIDRNESVCCVAHEQWISDFDKQSILYILYVC